MMRLKDEVLLILKEHRGEFISGERIAEELHVSRAAVWKAVKSLEEGGIEIEGISRRGYRLKFVPDILNERVIKNALLARGYDVEVSVRERVSSTNRLLLGDVIAGAAGKERMRLLVADEQTTGRGRRMRSFFSPKGTGLYMSLLFFPELEAEGSRIITCMMAAAAARVLEEMSGKRIGIKWMNDLFIGEKKVAGILTEIGVMAEDGAMDHCVAGIGINMYPPEDGFPAEIADTAGAVFTPSGENDLRNAAAAGIIVRFLDYLYGKEDFFKEYENRQLLTGKYVKVERAGGRNYYAKVKGINRECSLLLETDDGRERIINAGEASVVGY